MRVAVGSVTLVSSAGYLLSELMELVHEGFSWPQLLLTYTAFALVPFAVIGLHALQHARADWTSLAGATAYGLAYVFYAGTALYALAAETKDSAALVEALGGLYTAHGFLLIAGGLLLGGAVMRARVSVVDGPGPARRHDPGRHLQRARAYRQLAGAAECHPQRSARWHGDRDARASCGLAVPTGLIGRQRRRLTRSHPGDPGAPALLQDRASEARPRSGPADIAAPREPRARYESRPDRARRSSQYRMIAAASSIALLESSAV